MTDLREVFEMTVKQMGEPDLESWQEQEKRQRRANRNKRVGAMAVAAVLVIGAVVGGISLLGRGGDGVSATSPSVELGQQVEHLSIVNVDTGAATRFAAPLGATYLSVSHDGSMIAYSNLDADGNPQVYVMGADGSNVRQLTDGSGNMSSGSLQGCPCADLAWSPDDSLIAYQRETSDGPQIFTVGVADGVSTQVTSEPDGAVDPGGFTPDGASIIYMTPNYPINHYSAMSIDLETGRTEQVLAAGSTSRLSPDGSKIAFNSWLKPPTIRLFFADSDGSGRHLIARLEGGDGMPEWSPDSTRIAFFGRIGGKPQAGTYVYDLGTGERRFLTDRSLETWIDDDHILVS